MIRVVVCDTFPVLLTGLTDILREANDIRVIATCSTGAEALTVVRTQDPDILLTDLWLRDGSGLELAQTLVAEHSHTRVILVANTMNTTDSVKALRSGVRGIITMEMPPLQIITCVRSVHAGHTWLDAPAAHQTLDRLLRQQTAVDEYAQRLTPQELTISQLVAEGLSNREIADRLGIREGTVKLHLHHVYEKLGISNRIALVLHVRDHTLV